MAQVEPILKAAGAMKVSEKVSVSGMKEVIEDMMEEEDDFGITIATEKTLIQTTRE
jgi:hypothetical protein